MSPKENAPTTDTVEPAVLRDLPTSVTSDSDCQKVYDYFLAMLPTLHSFEAMYLPKYTFYDIAAADTVDYLLDLAKKSEGKLTYTMSYGNDQDDPLASSPGPLVTNYMFFLDGKRLYSVIIRPYRINDVGSRNYQNLSTKAPRIEW